MMGSELGVRLRPPAPPASPAPGQQPGELSAGHTHTALDPETTSLGQEGLVGRPVSHDPTAHVTGDPGTQTGGQVAPRQWGLVWGSQGGGRGPLAAPVGCQLGPVGHS